MEQSSPTARDSNLAWVMGMYWGGEWPRPFQTTRSVPRPCPGPHSAHRGCVNRTEGPCGSHTEACGHHRGSRALPLTVRRWNNPLQSGTTQLCFWLILTDFEAAGPAGSEDNAGGHPPFPPCPNCSGPFSPKRRRRYPRYVLRWQFSVIFEIVL